MSTSGFRMPAENPAGHDNDKRVAEFLHDLRYYWVRLTLLLSLLCYSFSEASYDLTEYLPIS
jgi:hypothetical protein